MLKKATSISEEINCIHLQDTGRENKDGYVQQKSSNHSQE